MTSLTRFAARYTSSSAIAERIVRRTIMVAATDPNLLLSNDVKQDLLSILHEVALQEVPPNPFIPALQEQRLST
ncbi:hypothetical protein [Rhizobium halophilum]|uniref:hypothetical protein n=1 Tax=Rhizobium halophilum TaxID=2846852 RepID=UPI001EFD5647|nr:hypothetical protein [Rhizobium halophilum]MCF6371087.1 hypothetical protein [Rhizobium halophilum]